MFELRTFLPLSIRGEGLLGSCSFFLLLDSVLVFITRVKWVTFERSTAGSMDTLTTSSLFIQTLQNQQFNYFSLPLIYPVPFIYTNVWLCSNTTCKEAYLSISALQKQPHVYKDKTSMLRSNNATLPPIQRSLSLTTWHPPGLADPPLCSKIIC